MRMRTATVSLLVSDRARCEAASGEEGSLLLPFLLALLGPFLGSLAVPGVAAGHSPQHPRARIKGARLAQARHHLDALPHAHVHHLPHQRTDLLELLEELLDLVRFRPTAGGDAAATIQI